MMKLDKKKSRKFILLITMLVLVLSVGYFVNTTARSYQTWVAINSQLKRSDILEAYLGHSAYILLLEKPFPAEKSDTIVQECIFATVVYIISQSRTVDFKFIAIHEENSNKTRLLLLESGSFNRPLPRTECVYPSAREGRLLHTPWSVSYLTALHCCKCPSRIHCLDRYR